MANPLMRLLLLHGRDDPKQDMDDWGYNGPVLENIVAFHGTYQSTFVIYFADEEAAQLAHGVTGWPFRDEHALEMQFVDDMVILTQEEGPQAYFGDYEFQTRGRGE